MEVSKPTRPRGQCENRQGLLLPAVFMITLPAYFGLLSAFPGLYNTPEGPHIVYFRSRLHSRHYYWFFIGPSRLHSIHVDLLVDYF